MEAYATTPLFFFKSRRVRDFSMLLTKQKGDPSWRLFLLSKLKIWPNSMDQFWPKSPSCRLFLKEAIAEVLPIKPSVRNIQTVKDHQETSRSCNLRRDTSTCSNRFQPGYHDQHALPSLDFSSIQEGGRPYNLPAFRCKSFQIGVHHVQIGVNHVQISANFNITQCCWMLKKRILFFHGARENPKNRELKFYRGKIC